MTDATRVRQRFAAARSERARIERRLDDCYKYALPGRLRFHETPDAGQVGEEIYDETAVVALEDYSSVIHGRMTPDGVDWVSLSADRRVAPRDRIAVNRDLEDVCRYLFERVRASNFSQEAQESYLDLGCSTGAMLIEWRDGLAHSSLPLTQVYFEAGVDDSIGGLFRRRDVRAELIPAMYPNAKIEGDLARVVLEEQDRKIEVIDAMWRSYGTNHAGERHVLCAVPGRGDGLVLSDTFAHPAALPFVGFRFSKAAGEIYGRGPIMKVMSAIKTTNLVIELMLQNAAMSMIGMYQYDDDGVLNPSTIRVEPGVLIPRAPGSRGLERVQTAGAEFNVAGIVLEDQRRNIRNGTYTDALGDPNKTPFKATEAALRAQEMAGRISANIGRLSSEWIQPYIRRALWLMQDAGEIELRLPIERVLITPEGPLARAARQQGFNAFVQHYQTLAGIYGPAIAAAHFKPAELSEFLRQQLGTPASIMAEPDAVQETIKAGAQMMQDAAAPAPTGAPIQ